MEKKNQVSPAMTPEEMEKRIATLEKEAMIMDAFRGLSQNLGEMLDHCKDKVEFVREALNAIIHSEAPEFTEGEASGLFWLLDGIENEMRFISDNAPDLYKTETKGKETGATEKAA